MGLYRDKEDVTMTKLRELAMQQQWEITKGHMRAMVVLAGQRHDTAPINRQGDGPTKFEQLGEQVEAFIEAIEQDGLHEG